ncbi:hypothetical protein PS704_02778 [Pseudomonas fluorescens]|uniref:Uncharacterized protein n=1 Tax=Pseudomonas fluorescens TaxID=294 RepID=A0A5E7CCW4_PSEFL|nr:hypothetical protein PS676_02748 [Pseudomonas fluorescens]VVO02530.1 hypothetical protein PS704_02778 [Pseudomonas fluorescens]
MVELIFCCISEADITGPSCLARSIRNGGRGATLIGGSHAHFWTMRFASITYAVNFTSQMCRLGGGNGRTIKEHAEQNGFENQ